MSRPQFTSAIIAALRGKVIAHNERAPIDQKVKLQDLKKVYERGHRDHEQAMQKVDAHLAKVFDPKKHPRGSGGKFSEQAADAAVTASNAAENAARATTAAAADALHHAKRAAHHTAYFAGIADEPPPKRGTKVPKLPFNLPADREEHRAGQYANAGYNAITSDAIPETRFEVAGEAARFPLSYAAALALLVPLARGKKGGVLNQMLRHTGGTAGKVLGLMTPREIARLTSKVGKPLKAQRAGQAVGEGTFNAASFLVRTPVKLVARDTTGWKRRGRQAGVVATIAIPVSSVINDKIKGTGADPAVLGQGYDESSYRVIRKALFMPELNAIHGAIVDDLRKSSTLTEDLLDAASNKKLRPLYSLAGRAAVSTISSLVGAGTGAAVGAGGEAVRQAVSGRRGNPNHDRRGRFASTGHAAENTNTTAILRAAMVGAGIGAAAGGGASHFLLGRHNRAVFRGFPDALSEQKGELKFALGPPGGKSNAFRVKRLIDAKEGEINKALKSDKDIARATADDEQYGASAPHYYQAKIRAAVNQHLGKTLATYDDFEVPSLDSTISMKALSDRFGNTGGMRRENAAIGAVASMSPSQFEAAIAKLTPAQKKTAQKLLALRTSSVEAVPHQVEKHLAKIVEARGKVDNASQELKEATAEHGDVKAEMDGELDETAKAAMEPKLTAAGDRVKRARTAVEKATKVHEKLRDDGPDIKHPIQASQRMLPPTLAERRMEMQTLEDKVRKAKSAQLDREIEAKRATLAVRIAEGHDHALAAGIKRARRVGGVPRDARGEVRTFLAASKDHEAVGKALAAARSDHDRIKLEGRAAKDMRDGKPVDKYFGKIKADRLAILRGFDDDHFKEATKAAKSAIDKATTAHAATRAALNEAGGNLHERLNGHLAAGQRTMPMWLRSSIVADVRRAGNGVSVPIKRYVTKPTSAAFRKAISATPDIVKSSAGAVRRGTIGAYRSTFTTPREIDGKTYHVLNPHKVANVVAAFGGLAGAVEAGKEVGRYLHDKGTGKPAKAPRNPKIEQYIDPIHGGGYVGLSVQDPHNKMERILLWGERYGDADANPVRLHAGAKMSEVRQRVKDARGQGGGGGGAGGGTDAGGGAQDMPFDNDEQKKRANAAMDTLGKNNGEGFSKVEGGGVSLRVRKDADTTQDNVAGEVRKVVRTKFLKGERKGLEKGNLHNALAQGVFSKQGALQKAKHAYSLITGFNEDGNPTQDNGVFKPVDAYKGKDQDQISDALSDEADRIMSSSAPNDGQRTNVKRAFALVAHVKGISADAMKPIYEKLNAAGSAPEGEVKKGHAVDPEAEHTMPTSWGDQSEKALRNASALGPHLNMTTPEEKQNLAEVLTSMAVMVNSITNAPPEQAFRIARVSVQNFVEGKNPKLARQTIQNARMEDFYPYMERAMADAGDERKPVKKLSGADLDDLEVLLKRVQQQFVDPNDPTATPGQEVGLATAKAGSMFAPRGIKQGIRLAARGALVPAAGAAPNYKASAEIPSVLSDFAANEIVGHGIRHLTRAPEFNPLKPITSLAGEGGSLLSRTSALNAAKLVTRGFAASAAGSLLYNHVNSLLNGGKYNRRAPLAEQGVMGAANAGAAWAAPAVVGRLVPKAASVEQSAGNAIKSAVRRVAAKVPGLAGAAEAGATEGAEVGSVAEPGLGTVAGVVVGGVAGALGEALGHYGYQHFAGYDPKTVSRIMKTKPNAESPSRVVAATAGETAGGGVGSAFGGAKGDAVGGVLGSIIGSKFADKFAPGKSSLQRRPKAATASPPFSG